MALLSTSSFINSTYGSNSKYSESNVKSLLESYTDGATYFSNGEKAYMKETTVSTVEYDGTERTAIGKLYLPDAEDRASVGDSKIYVGASNDIQIVLGKLKRENGF